jgi:UrcA family protein
MSLASLAGLALAAAQPLPAQAQAIAFKSEQVVYGDLDLASDKGVDRLYRRIQSAARQVCSTIVVPGDAEAYRRAQACTADAMAHAVASVHSDKLSQLYAERSAPPVETASVR